MVFILIVVGNKLFFLSLLNMDELSEILVLIPISRCAGFGHFSVR